MPFPQLNDTYETGGNLEAAEYDSLVRILNTQLKGALASIGEGVLSGFTVTPGTGLSVVVAANSQLILNTQYGYTYGASANPVTRSGLPANATGAACVRVWVAAMFYPDQPQEYDTHETGYVQITFTTSATVPADSQLIAEVVTNGTGIVSVTDRRTLLSSAAIDALAALVAELKEDVTDLDSRVSALEGGTGGGSVVYIAPATWKAGSAETTEQAVDRKDAAVVAQLEAEIAAIAGGETAATLYTPWNLDADALAQVTFHYIRRVDPFGWQRVPGAIIIDGVCGEGSNGSTDYIDRTNSTW